MNAANHIIEKLFLEVNTTELQTANVLKDSLADFLRQELFRRLERLFDELSLNEMVVRMGTVKLEISLTGGGGKQETEQQIVRQVIAQLEKHIREVIARSHFQTNANGLEVGEEFNPKIPFIANREAVFLFFLENGFLPWFGSREHVAALTSRESWKSCMENDDFVNKMKQIFERDKTAVERFLNQFPELMSPALLLKINPALLQHRQTIDRLLQSTATNQNWQVSGLLFRLSFATNHNATLRALQQFFGLSGSRANPILPGPSAGQSTTTEWLYELVQFLHKIIPEATWSDSRIARRFKFMRFKNLEKQAFFEATAAWLQTAKQSVELSGSEDKLPGYSAQDQIFTENGATAFFGKSKAEIRIQNAGLILLHPFLKQFFVRTEVADEQGNLLREKLDLAVQSLHFLATGKENVFEGNLVFEKFLCGLPLKMPVEKQSLLNDTIRNEAEVLLKEAISNWKALKNSSPNDLRQLFIQREGKLIQKENQYKLIVERKAQDALLERISWNISMLKLPWRKELIVVEW